MGRIRQLDDALLAAFESALTSSAPGLLDQTPPGLDDQRIAAAFDALGVSPSPEAITWWRWRDGSDLSVLPGCQHLSLAGVLDGYRSLRRAADELAADPELPAELRQPDRWWHPQWIPILSTGGQEKIALDCSDRLDAVSPLRSIDWPSIGTEHYGEAFAPSLGDFIQRAVAALGADRFRYDLETNSWRPADWADLPLKARF